MGSQTLHRATLIVGALLVLGTGVAQAARPTDGSKPARAKTVQLATHVSAKTLNRVGAGKLTASQLGMTKLSGPSLKSNGKPELLAESLAWCPHCEAISWAITIALSRFGDVSALRQIDSGTLFCTKYHANPCFPHTHGLSFFDASYQSSKLSFADVILQDLKGNNLEKPTAKEQKAFNSFDPHGSDPALDIGGVYGLVGLPYSPGILAHTSWLKIAQRLSEPNTPIAQWVDGLANVLTAALCKTTNQHPASVCSSKGVTAGAALLPS